MLCKNLDKNQTQFSEVEKMQGNNNQNRHDQLDKHGSCKSVQSGRSPGRLCSTLIILLEEGTTRLVPVIEKEQILYACKFYFYVVRSAYKVTDLP